MKKNPIGKYLLQNWYYYVFAFGSMALSVFLDMLAPLVTLHIVDDVLVGHKMELLWKYLAAFLLIGAAKALFQYIKEFLFDVSSVRVASQMRGNLFRHVQRLSVEYFDKNNTGELLARVRDDVDRIWDILGFAGMLILEGLICIMMAMVSMVKLDLPLTLVSVAILPFVAGIAIRLEKELDRVYDAISEENAVMNTVAQENLAGVRTVKSFAREPYEIKKFRKHNQKYCDLNMDQARVLMKYDPAISFLTKLMRVLVLLAGGYGVIHGRITLGVLTAFMEYTSKITWPIENVGWLGNCFASAIASNKKLNKILAEEPQIAEPENPVELSKLPCDLEFHHVDFSLHDTPILQDIDFTLKQGHTLGIMGMTGSGKTTIVNLLERFYDVTDGSICLDGHDIRTLPLRTDTLISLFTTDTAVREICHGLIHFLVPTFFTYISIEILSGALRGVGDAWIPMFITGIGICGVRIVWMTAVLPHFHSLKGAAFCYPLSWVITTIAYFIYYLFFSQLSKRKELRSI